MADQETQATGNGAAPEVRGPSKRDRKAEAAAKLRSRKPTPGSVKAAPAKKEPAE